MTLDIILVTYNSSKYIKKCIETIIENEYNLKHIGIKVYDNASTDNSITILEELKTKYEKELNSFQIIKGKKNIGFGKANNLAAKTSNAKYLLFLNIHLLYKLLLSFLFLIFHHYFLSYNRYILFSKKITNLFFK